MYAWVHLIISYASFSILKLQFQSPKELQTTIKYAIVIVVYMEVNFRFPEDLGPGYSK